MFWGVSSIENVYSALVNKSNPTLIPAADIASRHYLWTFIKENQ